MTCYRDSFTFIVPKSRRQGRPISTEVVKDFTVFAPRTVQPRIRIGFKILMGKLEGKRPLGSPRRRWEDNIEMDLRQTGRGSIDWIYLAQNRYQWGAVVNTVMNLRVP
jgi:hypothetical protein